MLTQRILLAVVAGLAPAVVRAAPEPHPALDRFSFALGGYSNSLGLEGRFDGSIEDSGSDIDFDEDFDIGTRRELALGALEWRFADRHQINLEYFDDTESRTQQFDEDIEFEGVTFSVEGEVTGRVGIKALETTYTYWAWLGERGAFGVNVGALNYEARVSLEGEIREAGGGTGEGIAIAKDRLHAPVVGASWRYGFNDHVRVFADGTLLDTTWDGIDGRITNLTVGTEIFPWEHLGFVLSYANTVIRAEAQEDDLRGRLRLEFSGLQALVKLRF